MELDAASDVRSADRAEGAPEGGNDAADSADSGWSPLSLPGLALWLEAGVGMELDGDHVMGWNDQSPNHHRAFPFFVGLTPTFVSEGIGPHAAVAFSGTGDMLIIPDAPSLRLGSRDFVVTIVFRHTTPTVHLSCELDYAALYLKVNTNRPFNGLEIFANVDDGTPPIYAGLAAGLDGFNSTLSSRDVSYNDDVPRVFATYRRQDFLTLRVNGAPHQPILSAATRRGAPNIDAIGYDVNIGAQPEKIQVSAWRHRRNHRSRGRETERHDRRRPVPHGKVQGRPQASSPLTDICR